VETADTLPIPWLTISLRVSLTSPSRHVSVFPCDSTPSGEAKTLSAKSMSVKSARDGRQNAAEHVIVIARQRDGGHEEMSASYQAQRRGEVKTLPRKESARPRKQLAAAIRAPAPDNHADPELTLTKRSTDRDTHDGEQRRFEERATTHHGCSHAVLGVTCRPPPPPPPPRNRDANAPIRAWQPLYMSPMCARARIRLCQGDLGEPLNRGSGSTAAVCIRALICGKRQRR